MLQVDAKTPNPNETPDIMKVVRVQSDEEKKGESTNNQFSCEENSSKCSEAEYTAVNPYIKQEPCRVHSQAPMNLNNVPGRYQVLFFVIINLICILDPSEHQL